jgi:hypothetical protein
MRKVLTAIAVVATLGLTALATSSPADAWWRGGGWGWRGGCCWGPGPFVGGLAAGAVVGGALAARPYYYGYYPYGPYPYYGAGCRRVWNGYYWVRACY